MSGEEIKKAGDFEDNLGLAKAEISEVTITEYRKSQIVRMGECAIGIGLIGVGVGFRKKIPTWLSVSLGVVGAGMTVYNGRNLYLNFKQDGKLIREAIKMKKVEEKKVRDERKKKPETAPASEEKKAEQPSPAQNQKLAPKKAPAGNNNSNGSPIVATSGNPVPESKSPVVNGKPVENNKLNGDSKSGKEVMLKWANPPLEFDSQEANITESSKKEGEEIIATIVEAEAQVESFPVEATITSTEAIPVEENGREVVR
jgi:hypothetical protein